MKQIFTIWILLMFVSWGRNAGAIFRPEKLYVRNIHLKDGLSQCVVTDLVQDNDGFLWAGTFDGLNRFDGNNIKVYRHNPEDSNSILSSKIFKVAADGNHHLYLRTNDGFCIFDCRTEKMIKPAFLQKYRPGWVANHDQFHIWYHSPGKGILLVDNRDFSYRVMEHSEFPPGAAHDIVRMIERGRNLYCILSSGDICIYDFNERRMLWVKNNVGSAGICHSADIDKEGRIFIASNESDLVFFDTRNGRYYTSDLYKHNQKLIAINKVLYDSINDLLLVSTYGQGLFVYEYQTDSLYQFRKNMPELAIASNYLQSLWVNEYGMIYIAYDGMGIDVLDPFIRKFFPVTYEGGEDHNNLKYVRKIVEDDNGNLFIGTSESGLVKYDRQSRKISFYNFVSSITENRAFILDILKRGQELWLGYNGSGVGIIDLATMKEKRNLTVGNAAGQISNGAVWAFLEDKDGMVWVGTRENGINKVDPRTFTVTQYDKTHYPEFINNGVRCMAQYSPGELMLGTENGLFTFEMEQGNLRKVFPPGNASGSFKSVKSIYRDYKKRYWVTTDGGGIVVLNEKYELLRNFNTSNGLNNNVVYGILPQHDSSFWISTNAGISNMRWNEDHIYNDRPLNPFNYDEQNGLQSNEFNTGAYSLLKDGSMVFGGLNGINIFKPEEIVSNPVKPKVYINEFKVFENPLQSGVNISYLDEVKLDHFENSISVAFSTIGFSMPGKIQFRYRLLGYDKDWIDAGSRNYVSFTNLKPGKYEFQVKASNYDGVWGEEYKSLRIFIATPWYNTWWFYALVALLAGSLVFAFYRMRIRQIRDKERITLQFTRELADVEMKALRAQINPHFLFNSLNSINNYILKNDTKQASRYLIKFSQLVRNILNNSSSPYITLQEELQTIELYMLIEGMRFTRQFSYSIHVDESLNTAVIHIPSLLLQPYVENAIWHGLLHKEGEKNIIISVRSLDTDSLSISIEDNGVGRKAAEEIEQKPEHHKSFGMQIGESRLRLLNQSNGQMAKVQVTDLYDEEGKARGTRIEIVIPAKIFINETTILN